MATQVTRLPSPHLESVPELVPPAGRPHMTGEQYRRLAEFRYQMRRFLHFSQEAATSAGLHAKQYQMLQAIAGMPEDMSPTIAAVAARMCLRHNSAVELVNRTIEAGLLRKAPDPIDHRKLLLQITPAGNKVLSSLVEFHLRELEELGPELIRALKRLMSIRQDKRPPSSAGLDSPHDPSDDAAELDLHLNGTRH
jgi:DNA-binding MarR family transcriptional regulator